MPLASRGRSKPAVQPAGGDIPLSSEDRTPVAQALHALLGGDSRAFCDILWLGLGDRWAQMRDLLVKSQCIANLDPDSAEGIEILDRGRTLAARLSDYR